VRVTTIFNKLLGLQGLWVTWVSLSMGIVVLGVRPTARRAKCPHCGKSQSCDRASKMRRWRHLGIWGTEVWLEGPIRRFFCKRCRRTVTEEVAWARPGSNFTRRFEDAVGLLAQTTDRTTVHELFGIAWVTVGSIAERLVGEFLDPERLTRLRRIGVDEISFRKRHRYLTIVTDHDTGDVVWVAEGKSSDTLKGFFAMLGKETCDAIEIVTMDMSQAYQKAVRECLPGATIAFDHFHIAKLANEALSEVRRQLVRETKPSDPDAAKDIKGTRWLVNYRLDNLPDKHVPKLAMLRPEQPLGRAYLLKEQLLDSLRYGANHVRHGLDSWMAWASRSRLEPFVRLGRTIRNHVEGIVAFVEKRVSNARAEGINNKVRLLSHRAYGFHSAASLIATIYLCCGGISLPVSSHLL